MDLQTLLPPAGLLEDFQALEAAIDDDAAGDQTRALVTYFRQAEVKSQELGLRTQDYEEKQFARLLHEAFAAASRIVLANWADAHGAELTV